MDADKARALLKRAIDASYENYTLDEVGREIADGSAKVFTGDNSLLVMSLMQHHEERTAHVWLGAGDLNDLTGPLKDAGEAWAREQGCKAVTIEGRKGWDRTLPDYEVVSVTLRKEL